MTYSTLQGSTIVSNDVISPIIQSGSILFSTLQINTSNISTLTSCTINTSNSNVSTLQGSTLIASTLSGSTIITGGIFFSTIAGSSMVANNITANSTFSDNGTKFFSSYLVNASQIYTSQLSTLSVLSTLTVSTLYRVNPSSLTYSTLTLAAGLQSNTVATSGFISCSSMTATNINVARSVVNEPVYGQTVKIESIVNSSAVIVKTSGIQAKLDAPSSNQQIYTFGPAVPNRWVATADAPNTLVYSNDGFNWLGLGASILGGGRCAVWNGTMWVAVGDVGSYNSIAYSYDGIKWTGTGVGIFTTYGMGVVWNGNLWVAVGGGTNSIAYSYDGINWIGLGTTIFTVYGQNIVWNGTMFVACGNGTNTLAYSYDGIVWMGAGAGILTSYGFGLAWNGTMWVATGSGGNSLAYSNDGIVWYGIGNIYPIIYTVAWNGIMWIAGSDNATHTLLYSYNGMNWFGLGKSIFSTAGRTISWNGTMWVAGGSGTNTVAYSYNGLKWYELGTSGGVITSYTYGVGFNARRPHQIVFPASISVATGSGVNTLAYSTNGINWIGLGVGIFSDTGTSVAWNGSIWVATGSGTNTLAYSTTIDTPYIHLPFENSTYTDVIGNSVVTAYGSPAFVTGCRGSKAVNLSNIGTLASQYIYGTWSGSDNFTVSFWFNMTSFIIANGQAVLFSAYGGALLIIIYANSLSVYWSGIKISSSAIPSTAKWYYVTYVHQKNGLCSLYLNNSLVGTYTNSGGLGTSTNFGIGTYDVNTNSPFNGYIDDFRIYHYAVNINSRITWRGLGTSIFSGQGKGVAWNGVMWVAVGNGVISPGINSIAYSYDGITWIGLGIGIFSTSGNGIAWNGVMWVAVGSGTNTLAYSYNGIVWTGLGNVIFSTQGNAVAWNGALWVAVGSGTNSIAYSYDGIVWTGLGVASPLFSSSGNGIAWNGNRWVAVGSGGNTILYSTNGINWTAAASSCFTIAGNGVTWNETRWVATGSGSNTTGYSSDGSTWTGGASTLFSSSGAGIAWNGGLGSTTIQHPVIAVGQGPHTLAYSPDGIQWIGLGTSIFSTAGYGVAWNGTLWVAVGQGTNTISYSYDGLRWTGLGTFVFSQGNGIAWNGSLWVAVGNGANTLAYSTDGMTWIGSTTGNAIFTTSANSVAWNGKQWVAVGQGTNSIAYSADGITWTAVGSTVFSTKGNGVAWTGSLWVAVGAGINSIASSVDGIAWSPPASSPFTSGNGICWNGVRWVAVGQGTNSIAYSANGTTWTGFGNALFSTAGYGVCWTGTRFVAVGSGTNTMIYSQDGLTWYAASSGIFTQGNGVAGNSRIGATVCDSQLVLNANEGGSNTLDIVSDTYCNTGYTNFSATIQAQTYASSGVATSLVTKTLPDAPTAVFATLYPSGATTGMNVSFTYPTNVGGGIDLYYVSAIDTNGIQPTVTTSSSISPIYVSGLVPGTTYRFTVYSSNSAGQSAATSSVSTLLYQITPGAPTSVTAALTPIGNPIGVLVSFTPPVNLGGGVSSYTATAYSGATAISSASGPSSPLTITGLTAGTTYTYSVKATNTGGTGAVSTNVPSLKYIIQPAAPTTVSVSLYPIVNPSGIRVTFTSPTNVSGDTVTYYASAIDVSPNGQATVTLSSLSSPIDMSAGLVAGTTYQISVYSSNTAGQSAATPAASTLFYQTVPDAPTLDSVALTPTGDPTGVLVSFTAPANTGGGISSYTATAYSGATVVSSVTGPSSPLTINGLSPGTTYTYKVIATNTSGNSAASVNVPSLTYYKKPTKPTVISVALDSPTTPTGVNVTFGASSDTGGGILTYVATAYYSDSFVSQSVPSSSGTLYVTGLPAGNSYTYRVVATNTADPTIVSDASDPSSEMMYYTQPSKPTDVLAALSPPLEPSGVSISFTASSDTGGSALTYTATAYLDGVPTSFSASGSSSPLFIEGAKDGLANGLEPGTTYTYMLVASNNGALSNSVTTSALTYYTKPATPTIGAITLQPSATPTGVKVAFTAPTNTTGGTLTYTATAYIDGIATTITGSGATSPVYVSGLTAGISYTYRIVASNVAVPTLVSDTSEPSDVLTYYTQPAQPTGVLATLSPPLAPTGVSVAFTASTDTGGAPLTYTATAYFNSVATAFTASGSSTTLFISGATSGLTNGLVAGTAYTFIVTSSNGTLTNMSTPPVALTYYTKPSKPTLTGVALDSPTTPTGVNVQFGASSDTGGGTLLYTASAYDTNGTLVRSSDPSATTPLYINGLTAGTVYRYRITARNGAVTSDQSTENASLMYETNPAAPVVTASAILNTTTISWTAPTTNGGSAIASYRVVSSPAGYDSGTLPATTTSVTATGLTNGTLYTFTVTAVNVSGFTSSGTSSVTPYTLPGVPTGFTGVAGIRQIILSWTAPNNGGRAISGYKIINTTTSTTITTSSTSYTWTDLPINVSYSFTVAATNNGVNYGPIASVTGIPYDVPAATNISSTSQGFQSVTLNWTAPADNSSPITSYDASYNNGASWTIVGNVLSYTFGGLSGGTYTLRARAYNGAGAGLSGTSGSQTLPAAPSSSPSITSVTTQKLTDPNNGGDILLYVYSTFNWGTTAGATGYILYRSNTGQILYNGSGTSAGVDWRYVDAALYSDSWSVYENLHVVAYNNGGYAPQGPNYLYQV
jgi:hypothetical protein